MSKREGGKGGKSKRSRPGSRLSRDNVNMSSTKKTKLKNKGAAQSIGKTVHSIDANATSQFNVHGVEER